MQNRSRVHRVLCSFAPLAPLRNANLRVRHRMLQVRLGGQRSFMPVVRALARPMLASIFIIQGYDTFRRPERVAAKAEPVVRPVAERVPVVPAKAEQAVQLNGAVQMTAGSLLALGRWP